MESESMASGDWLMRGPGGVLSGCGLCLEACCSRDSGARRATVSRADSGARSRGMSSSSSACWLLEAAAAALRRRRRRLADDVHSRATQPGHEAHSADDGSSSGTQAVGGAAVQWPETRRPRCRSRCGSVGLCRATGIDRRSASPPGKRPSSATGGGAAFASPAAAPETLLLVSPRLASPSQTALPHGLPPLTLRRPSIGFGHAARRRQARRATRPPPPPLKRRRRRLHLHPISHRVTAEAGSSKPASPYHIPYCSTRPIQKHLHTLPRPRFPRRPVYSFTM